ncbi:MAG: hypothetical protein LBC08_02340 [Campylobacteraceae bacterium]|jgi:hypothetical protein|nr:hypothetical protein [Campylobacteraceae bacterium]
MIEKVHCVNNFWDMTIVEGIADYNDKKYYFNCIFSNDIDDWTDIYELTLLDDYIFELALENWEYWKNWLKKFNKKFSSEIPHPVEYAKTRKTLTVDEIFNGKNIERDAIELTEKYYQNEIIINKYLKDTKPIYKATGTFLGKIDGMDTKVEWKNVIKI